MPARRKFEKFGPNMENLMSLARVETPARNRKKKRDLFKTNEKAVCLLPLHHSLRGLYCRLHKSPHCVMEWKK